MHGIFVRNIQETEHTEKKILLSDLKYKNSYKLKPNIQVRNATISSTTMKPLHHDSFAMEWNW